MLRMFRMFNMLRVFRVFRMQCCNGDGVFFVRSGLVSIPLF